MRRVISFALSVLFVLSCFGAFSASAGGVTHGFTQCDANDDGEVDMKDVLLVRRFVAGLVPLRDIDLLAADVNSDGGVDMKDVLFIRRVIAGLEEPSGNNTDLRYRVGTLTVGGRNISRYAILIEPDADECMRYSARLLMRYIKETCGITLNVTDSPTDDCYYIEYRLDRDDKYGLGDEGYRVTVGEDGNVVFDCGRLRGSLYVTYYFLEKLVGWRFLTGDIEYLYERDTVDIPTGDIDREVPVFEYRAVKQMGTTANNFAALRANAVDGDSDGSGPCADPKYGGGIGNCYIAAHS